MSPRFLVPTSLAAAAAGFLLAAGFPVRQTPDAAPPGEAAGMVPHGLSGAQTAPAAPSQPELKTPVRKPVSKEQEYFQKIISGSGAPADTRLTTMEVINSLGAAELGDLMAMALAEFDLYRTTRFDFQFAAKRLAEIAPELAAALWMNHRATHLSTDVLLVPWAKRDPQAFAAWSATLPPDAQKAVGQTMLKLAAEQPEQFLEIAPQLAKSPAGASGARGAISGLIAKAAKGDSPAAALAFAQSLPAGPARSAALAELVRWPGLDPADHPEIREALAQLSPSDARRYAQQLNPESLPPSAIREGAYASQFARAAQKDPQAAAKRVDALSNSPDYPAAVRGFVEATAAKDPVAAVEWALSIQSAGPQRSAALEKAVTEYQRLKPADAKKWVEKAPLTAEEYQMLTGRTR